MWKSRARIKPVESGRCGPGSREALCRARSLTILAIDPVRDSGGASHPRLSEEPCSGTLLALVQRVAKIPHPVFVATDDGRLYGAVAGSKNYSRARRHPRGRSSREAFGELAAPKPEQLFLRQ